MNWKELLKNEIEHTYQVTEELMDLVDSDYLEWKPSPENNWMTTGQVLMHLTNACGSAMKGFVVGDWGMPDGIDISTLPPEDMLPPAEKLPTIGSVSEAKRLLAEDKELTIKMLEKCDEERLANEAAPAPWDPTEIILGHRLLQMIEHLKQHKGQLYYYLKLQGKPVNTSHLWGM